MITINHKRWIGNLLEKFPLPLIGVIIVVLYYLTASQNALWGNNWDEPVYLYSGWLVHQGFNPYSFDLGFYVNPPLLPWFLALIIQVFGFNLYLMRFISALFLVAALVTVFFIGRKLKNDVVGYSAAFTLAIQPSFDWFGRCFQLENCYLVFDVAAICIYLSILELNKPKSWNILVGFFIAVSLGFKIQSVMIIIGFMLYLIIFRKWRDLVLIGGSTLFFSLFWFGIGYFLFGSNLISAILVTLARGDKWNHQLVGVLYERAPLLILLSVFGILVTLWKKENREKGLLIICLLVGAFLTFAFSNAFWTYMLLVWFPLLALLSGIGVYELYEQAISKIRLNVHVRTLLIQTLGTFAMVMGLFLYIPLNIEPFEDGNSGLFVGKDAPSVFARTDDFKVINSVIQYIQENTDENDLILSDPYIAILSSRITPQGGLPWVVGEHMYVQGMLKDNGFFKGRQLVRQKTNDYDIWWENFNDMAYSYYTRMVEDSNNIQAVIYPSIYGIWDMPWPIDRQDPLLNTYFYLAYDVTDTTNENQYQVWLRK